MNDDASLQSLIVVLHQPRKVVNIGGVVRVMKNMGLARLRLVSPPPFDPADVTGIAHRSEDILTTTSVYATLDEALSDTQYVVGTTARARSNHPIQTDIRALAATICQRVASETVALLFGPEDNGLDNAALDRCHTLLTLPTHPDYPSLNLAHAVLLLAYEVRMAHTALRHTTPEHTPPQPPPAVTGGQLDTFVDALEHALWAIDFFKGGQTMPTMRTLRGLLNRARPDQRELALLLAIVREIPHSLRRVGVGDTRP
jgi:tRNA/rRNA methyltransferase